MHNVRIHFVSSFIKHMIRPGPSWQLCDTRIKWKWIKAPKDAKNVGQETRDDQGEEILSWRGSYVGKLRIILGLRRRTGFGFLDQKKFTLVREYRIIVVTQKCRNANPNRINPKDNPKTCANVQSEEGYSIIFPNFSIVLVTLISFTFKSFFGHCNFLR